MPEVPSWRMKWRWLIWLVVVVLWTALLCSPIPEEAEQAVVGVIHFSRRELLAKMVHVIGYAFLTSLTGWLRVPWRFRVPLIFAIMAHGTVTEMIQLFIPSRTGRLTDVGIDNLGVLFGLVISWKWWSAEPST
jgi:VanZ family protein